MKKYSRRTYLIVCATLLVAVLVVLQLVIDRMDEHEPFRRAGLPPPQISLGETMQWLTAAIQGTEVSYSLTLSGQAAAQAAERQEEVTYVGCRMTVKISDLTFDTSGYQIAFDLSDLDTVGRPIKILADSGKVYWKVPLHTIEFRNLIQERFGLSNYTSFNVADPELAQRVGNAFNHAARLCRKVKRPAEQTSSAEAPPEKPEDAADEKNSEEKNSK